MDWDAQIPNVKLTLAAAKQLEKQLGWNLSLAKIEQFPLMEINSVSWKLLERRRISFRFLDFLIWC
jgi:hypothetical protein